MGGQDQARQGSAAGPSLLVLSPSVPFPGVPPAHLLPTPPPAGPPELRAEETQPKAEGGWREGGEVRLTCYARGYPEPKLSWSQLGGSVRDPPLHPEPSGTLPKSLPPQRSKHCVSPTPRPSADHFLFTCALTRALGPVGPGLTRASTASRASPRRPGLGEQLPDPEGDQCLEPRWCLL